MAGYVASGILYGGIINAPLKKLGNCRKFAITPNATIKKRTSKMIGTYGQVLDSASMAEPAKLVIEMDEWNTDNLRDAAMGTVIEATQEAGNDVEKSFDLTTVEHGGYYDLGKRRVSGVSVTVASVTKIEGTDYELDAEIGYIKFLEHIGSTGSAVVTFDCAAIAAGAIILGGTESTIKRHYLLRAHNEVDGSHWEIEVWEATLKPTSETDYLADDYSVLGFEGEMNTPTGKTSPYETRRFPAAA
ncbi:hypothetical protein G3N56_07840 [Desulfovibrio sulfodismutans]|uniref:Uncharacterized protein n=1 Tax=Desulfolutivibrio sulfodismutans TaxID=63561 RepID=A0A7K3NLD1_9BACT|nr:hypothetical protein [Desulfolutivibrio sulfodismutans]NDY56653.1 hypothetical protein [Desulfolutivibrio sulfodismutans]QLA11247.1 hypothetical protein GD606_02620 [Desulfolutivibrio sulfodismutans DSM 3696]